jgi:hypothetical protein
MQMRRKNIKYVSNVRVCLYAYTHAHIIFVSMYIYIYIYGVCVCVCVCVYQDFYKFFQEGDTPPSLYIVFANAYQEKVDVQKTSINGRTERFSNIV